MRFRLSQLIEKQRITNKRVRKILPKYDFQKMNIQTPLSI